MNRMMKIGLASLLSAATLTAFAAAADYTDCADRLNSMGLFLGTNAGYELDRTPTRAEAATMLVRLLGQEENAKALPYTAPFTDVDNWAKPYVQYLYQNGLTTGATATRFEPNGTCTAQMYSAFLLRALGYTEQAGDFQYDNAVAFAEANDIYDSSVIDYDTFHRDDVVAASYTALATYEKGSEQTLLSALVESGAVADNRFVELFGTYRQYRTATANMDTLTAYEVSTKVSGDTAELLLGDTKLSFSSEETMRVDVTGDSMLTDRLITLSGGDETITLPSQTYVTAGMEYRVLNGQKSRRPLTAKEQAQLSAGYARVPVALIDTITKSGSSYTVQYNAAGIRRLDGVLEAAQNVAGNFADLKISALTVTQSVSSGLIQDQTVAVSFGGNRLIMRSDLTAHGDAVKIMPPSDLTQYAPVQ